jgi:hypothetical protein
LRTLQTVIIVLGVLIVGGFGYVGVEIYRRATDPTHPRAFGREQASSDAAETAPVLPGGQLPAGSKIGEPVSVGYQAAVRVVLPDGTQQLILVDPGSGRSSVLLSAPAAPSGPGTP